ncbi:MAG TPA: YdcF family protein [Vicinamibacteria bacterium]|nr:YdcF family protein [Vicinamibacteria bacterium]
MAQSMGLYSAFSYWGDPAWFVPAGAAIGALAWPTRLRRLVACGALAMAALWLVVAFTPLTGRLVAGTIRRDALRAGDAIVVLASDVQDDGEPNDVEMQRLVRGVELLAEGSAPRLLVTELPAPIRPRLPAARELIRRLRVEGELLATDVVRNTYDEAVVTAALFRRRGWRTVLLVTSPTHSRRAAAVFDAQGLDVVSVPSFETRYDLEDLSLPVDRLEAFSAVVHERIGLWVYGRRGWLDGVTSR